MHVLYYSQFYTLNYDGFIISYAQSTQIMLHSTNCTHLLDPPFVEAKTYLCI